MRRRNQKGGGKRRRRTTIELSAEHGQRLRELAAARHERGFSKLIGEAIDSYLASRADHEARKRKALEAIGSLSHEEAEEIRTTAKQLREGWR